MACACPACQKGCIVGKPPPPGVDKRKWAVADQEGVIVAKTWYEDTAKEVARLKGNGHIVVGQERKRRKVTK